MSSFHFPIPGGTIEDPHFLKCTFSILPNHWKMLPLGILISDFSTRVLTRFVTCFTRNILPSNIHREIPPACLRTFPWGIFLRVIFLIMKGHPGLRPLRTVYSIPPISMDPKHFRYCNNACNLNGNPF